MRQSIFIVYYGHAYHKDIPDEDRTICSFLCELQAKRFVELAKSVLVKWDTSGRNKGKWLPLLTKEEVAALLGTNGIGFYPGLPILIEEKLLASSVFELGNE